jgi:hypothetical protein
MSALNLPYQHTTTVTSKAFIENNRGALLNFMKATGEAVFRLKKSRKDGLTALSKHLQLDPQKDSSALEEAYEGLKRMFTHPPYPSLDGIQALIDEVALDNPKASEVKPEQFTDLSVVQELETSGFFRELSGQKE